jgi:hypothetical protein
LFLFSLRKIPNVAWASYLQLTLGFQPWTMGTMDTTGSVLKYAYELNNLSDWIIRTGIECFYWRNILYWNIPTDWICCTGTCLRTEDIVLEYSYWMNILYCNISTDLKILYWNIPNDFIFGSGILLLTEAYVVLEYPYWLTIFEWNITTDWICCTGVSVLTE